MDLSLTRMQPGMWLLLEKERGISSTEKAYFSVRNEEFLYKNIILNQK